MSSIKKTLNPLKHIFYAGILKKKDRMTVYEVVSSMHEVVISRKKKSIEFIIY